MACVASRFLDEAEPDVIRTEAGGSFHARPDRFRAQGGRTASYDGVDPHYYRRSLGNSGNRRKRSTSRRGVSSTPPAASEGRRVVYDEGAAEIVPGVRVEHSHFGEGKVIAMEGRGEQTKVIVFFQEVGQKKLMLKFAKLRRIG